MTFMRLKTDSAGRVYLYEETRHREGKKIKSISHSHGRVHGFWFMMAIIVDNLSDIFRTKVNGVDQDEDERQAAQKSDEERDRDKQKLWEITHPGWAAPGVPEVTPPVSEAPPDVPAAPQPTTDTTPDVPAPDDASSPEPGQPSSPDGGAAPE